MADEQIRKFHVNINLIDSDNSDANKLADDLVAKIQEIKGIQVELLGLNLAIQVAGQNVQRHLKNVQTVEEGGKKKLKVDDVPAELQKPPQP